jgi:hypothetical protein
MSVSHPSSIRPFFTFKPRHHVFPNAFSSKRETVVLPNDDTLPTADVFTECFEENLLPHGTFLPNSAHRSVSSLYQFLVLTRTLADRRWIRLLSINKPLYMASLPGSKLVYIVCFASNFVFIFSLSFIC